MTALRLWLAVLLPALLPVAPASAEEQLVWWPMVTDGAEYRRVSYPAEAGALMVLADTEVVLEARRARVAFWPITREYLADISAASEPVEGRIEIVDAAGAVQEVEPEPYLLWHAYGVGAGPAELVRGEEVAGVYEDYLRRGREAAEQARLHQQLLGQHHAAVEAWVRLAAERAGDDMPPPPPEFDLPAPEPFHAYASEPREAALVSLPEGRYTLRLRDAGGAVVPGSERELVSFAALNPGIGYVIRPEDRWTQPVISFAPGEIVYTTGRTDLFVQPVRVAEFAARHYTRLFRPQSVEAADPFLTVWVPRPDAPDREGGAELSLSAGGEEISRLATTPFRVAQMPDRLRGYVIEEFEISPDRALQPDFFAMRIGHDIGLTGIGLVEDGAPLDTSERRIRRVAPLAEAWLFAPALLPLAFGVGLRLWLTGRRSAPRRAAGPQAAVQ